MDQQYNTTSTNNSSLFDLQIDAPLSAELKTVGLWARINAYVSFVSYGLAILKAAFGKVPGASEETSELAIATGRGAQLAGALITAIIGVIISIYLLRFGNQIKQAFEQQSQPMLESGFNNLRVYWKIIGILLIIVLSLMVLFLFLGILAGSVMR